MDDSLPFLLFSPRFPLPLSCSILLTPNLCGWVWVDNGERAAHSKTEEKKNRRLLLLYKLERLAMSSSHVMRTLTQQVKRLNIRNNVGVLSSSSNLLPSPASSSSRRSVCMIIATNSDCCTTYYMGQYQSQQQQEQRRNFSNDDGNDGSSGGGSGGSDLETSTPPSTDIVDYGTPEEIMEGFLDTSYYEGPIEKPDYSHMTNEDLMDTSTIPGWGIIHSPPKDRSIPRGALVGKVVSTKMQKTVNVAVDRYKIHRKYGKRLRFTRKFMAHDEKEVACDGDLVMIVPCHRISKHKHFMLREIVRAKGQL